MLSSRDLDHFPPTVALGFGAWGLWISGFRLCSASGNLKRWVGCSVYGCLKMGPFGIQGYRGNIVWFFGRHSILDSVARLQQ